MKLFFPYKVDNFSSLLYIYHKRKCGCNIKDNILLIYILQILEINKKNIILFIIHTEHTKSSATSRSISSGISDILLEV